MHAQMPGARPQSIPECCTFTVYMESPLFAQINRIYEYFQSHPIILVASAAQPKRFAAYELESLSLTNYNQIAIFIN